MQVSAGFVGLGARAALPGLGAVFFRYCKKLARFATLMGSRFHVPDMVGSFMLSMRDDVQAESSP
jgi:hypothetical protein